MSQPVLHQFADAATTGDAITDQIFLIRRWLRDMGFVSEIYAEHIADKLTAEVRPITSYRHSPGEQHLVYHHSIGSDVADRVLALPQNHIMIYHNITPPVFFQTSDPALAQKLARGRHQLELLRPRTILALGDSAYNEQELCDLGYRVTGILPITFDDSQYNLPDNPQLVTRYGNLGPRLLFVGRLVPNKKQEDLIKLLYYYRHIRPDAHLILVGIGWLAAYERWLRDLTHDLGLDDAVTFAGHASQQDLITSYRLADVYVSMSEHEGFGKPLIESMYMGLPVVAYAAASVPGTLGRTGILFHDKDLAAVAELIDLVIHDQTLRGRLINQQRARVEEFLEPAVRERWVQIMVGLMPALKESRET